MGRGSACGATEGASKGLAGPGGAEAEAARGQCGAVPPPQLSPVPAEPTGSNPGLPAPEKQRGRGHRRLSPACPGPGRLFPQPSRPGEGAAAASGHTCGAAAEEAPEVGADGSAPGGTMTVGARLGAKVRGRFSRRGPGDDQVSILPGEEEEEAAAAGAGGSAGAPLAAALQEEEEEGAGCRKVRFAVLPGSYEPLRPPRAPGKRPYGKRLKKYGKVRAQRARGGRSGDPRHGDPGHGDPRHGDPRHGGCGVGRAAGPRLRQFRGALGMPIIPQALQNQRPAPRWGSGRALDLPGKELVLLGRAAHRPSPGSKSTKSVSSE